MANKAIFLDKDGTLIPDIPYNVEPELIMLQENAVTGLKRLQDDGYLLIIISNQSGVARGYFTESALIAVESKMKSLFEANGLVLTGFYYCPHHPQGIVTGYDMQCDCRKPEPGMLVKAAADHDIDFTISWMIGDILNDVEAGNRTRCRTVLIDNGNETEWEKGDYRVPTTICKTIDEAAEQILKMNSHALAEL
ncbi:D-glycero-alpha-D-manno-heptose-1,7-bisphosphate 7-phosphatase [Mucilaginibacter sp.]|uniref:D-glycero-alpha-D-manno-heptose-1,7-bisphosphate 7-phosphatase n=1 Tax=Mucilaginibacter sp. TaxID=1882438 RepID=UPI0035BC215B